MANTLIKSFIITFRLKSSFDKTRSRRSWLPYKTQRNFCSKRFGKTKKYYFLKVNSKLVKENEKFCRTIKQYFSDKEHFSSKKMISEKKLYSFNIGGLSEILNEYFANITKTLDLKPSIISATTSLPEIIENFKERSSIKKNFSWQRGDCQFNFHSVFENEVRKF